MHAHSYFMVEIITVTSSIRHSRPLSLYCATQSHLMDAFSELQCKAYAVSCLIAIPISSCTAERRFSTEASEKSSTFDNDARKARGASLNGS